MPTRVSFAVLHLLIASHVVRADLILEQISVVSDPRMYDFEDQVKGDRGVPLSCGLSGGTTVTLDPSSGTIDVVRKGVTKAVAIDRKRMLGRSTLACDSDRFYYAAPRIGRLYAYSADKLFRGDSPLVWERSVEPFRSLDDAKGTPADASILTVVQVRRRLVLVEWYYRHDNTTEFWHGVYDRDGAPIGRIGPSDLLVKTNATDPWWVVFEGGGNDSINYVPASLYRLRVGEPAPKARVATEVLAQLAAKAKPQALDPVAKLTGNPVVIHAISLLTPNRSAKDPTIDFCSLVPPQRARYWLGRDYNSMLADVAQRMLLAFSADPENSAGDGNPIDHWFRAEIAAKEPMKSILAEFNPLDDRWVARYQLALLELGGPSFDAWFDKYVREDVEVIQDH